MTKTIENSGRSLLEIIAYGAWNGGIVVDNTHYEETGMAFKGGIPVSGKTIEDRIGIKTRRSAPENERIGVTAFSDLLATSGIDPAHIKYLIGATNVGDDKYDPGPQVRHAYELVRERCPKAVVIDLYAGCPGFNVAVELVFMLSLAGSLNPGDLSVIIGAENIHRAKAFKHFDTANIIFGDDALATALKTTSHRMPLGNCASGKRLSIKLRDPFVEHLAEEILELIGDRRIDGIIIDNQLGDLTYRVPATAVRVQHALVEKRHPETIEVGTFARFADALQFYDERVQSFAFDIRTLSSDPKVVETIARAYVESGK